MWVYPHDGRMSSKLTGIASSSLCDTELRMVRIQFGGALRVAPDCSASSGHTIVEGRLVGAQAGVSHG